MLSIAYMTWTDRTRQQAKSHKKSRKCNVERGEATRRKYKRFKLGGGQDYFRSSDKAAVIK
jgi:hypothetical protein